MLYVRKENEKLVMDMDVKVIIVDKLTVDVSIKIPKKETISRTSMGTAISNMNLDGIIMFAIYRCISQHGLQHCFFEEDVLASVSVINQSKEPFNLDAIHDMSCRALECIYKDEGLRRKQLEDYCKSDIEVTKSMFKKWKKHTQIKINYFFNHFGEFTTKVTIGEDCYKNMTSFEPGDDWISILIGTDENNGLLKDILMEIFTHFGFDFLDTEINLQVYYNHTELSYNDTLCKIALETIQKLKEKLK